mgnify:CR=1 FL=1
MRTQQTLVLHFVTFALAFVTTFCFADTETHRKESKGYLTVGSISNTPKEEMATFQPFADYLVANLNDPRYTKARVLVAYSLDEMIDLIQEEQVDLFLDSPFPIIAVRDQTGSVPFLLRWKKGIKEYNSVIFTHKDSGVNSLEDLKGKMVAFEEEFSTSGYFLPKATLMDTGLTLVEKLKRSARVPSNKVGYLFSKDDETTMYWVLKNLVHAGALNKNDFSILAKKRLPELKILKETMLVPRQLVVHRKSLPLEVVKEITETLISMDKNEEGRAVLSGFSKTKKFEVLDHSTLLPINKLYTQISNEFE